jgi:hypothetical protein
MRIKISATIVLMLLAASSGAQDVLYENPWNLTGPGNCQFTDACADNFSGQLAQSFTLTNAATVQAVSFVVSDPFGSPSRYGWSIFGAANGLPAGPPGPISLPTDSPTVLPIISSTGEVSLGNGGPGTYTYLNLIPGTGPPTSRVNEVTINTGPLTLGPGTYFFALRADTSEIDPEGWDAGIFPTGAASGQFKVWSTDTEEGSLAMTVIGTPAPEINPSSAMSALTLLFAGVMMLRGRRSE